ncbi:MAG: bifunctional demethylmenaquinone methyltransferase/2-methoxy-6-polyprenyl-1,4-benzoquinol methylase UbiE [Chloracidobacterium sp.]|uniref:Demethylmenaquinone methyltransferase n=1 Tax=Chloracidobacterium validum TaxID=2821543 RepID=A0ABX8B8Z9_9BACT|nr:bifunctional demethylmenaquinone methyltransferase/2-methoxy-6-polyprenyl-1,4-benzoquinol methylase UbiE [Chloracidobacterium validum]QUW03412.1 bifunctional demethylmenaquinone methyltransferase/2-methoxy-6-polyprenyl-1,4-benzoquinol methylase UbiE [Chloracidobacterium validum]
MESPIVFQGSEKAQRIQAMFAGIAPTYDQLNHWLSLNIDKRWRRAAVQEVADALARPGAQALDVCCGTADLAIELGRLVPTVGVDFCQPMLKRGMEKVRQSGHPVTLLAGDALALPFADASFDAVTVAFGIRNVVDLDGALAEMHRVLKPGGKVAILEFSHPVVPGLKQLFGLYFTQILPRIGNAISGSGYAYSYLPESVQHFPSQSALAAHMRQAGFENVRWRNLSGGIAALHTGLKPVVACS